MNIAYICPRYLYAGGGSVLHIQRLAQMMGDRGHTITMMCDAAPQVPADDPLRQAGYPVVELPRQQAVELKAKRLLALGNRRGFYRLAKWLFRSGRYPLTAAGPYCPGLADPALYKNYDVAALINSTTSPMTMLFNRAAARLHGTLTVAMPLCHVNEPSGQWPVHRKWHEHFDLINTSTYFETHWLAGRGWSRDRLQHIGVGSDAYDTAVDPEAFRKRHHIPAGVPLVLFLGRKIHNKGVTHVIQAMEGVWRQHAEARLALLGFSHNPPEWLAGFLNQSQYGAEEKTINLDDVSGQVREEALAACDVMAAPSISDSFGIVYLDAWRYRKPVIGCRDTSSESVIDEGRDGLLVPFGEVTALERALTRLLDDPGLAANMGRAGYQKWSTRYTWEAVAERTEQLYQERLTLKRR